MRALLRVDSKAPLAVGALISVPLYFAALMSATLALDKPRLAGRHEFPSTSGTEAKIWLAALIAPGIMLAAGTVGLFLRRFGVYLAAAAGIVVCVLLPGVSNGWIDRHEGRFPLGVDFIPDKSPSNLSSRGEWEHAAQSTITSITHWTLGLAIGAIAIAVGLEIRRRRGREAIIVPPPPPVAGDPQTSVSTPP